MDTFEEASQHDFSKKPSQSTHRLTKCHKTWVVMLVSALVAVVISVSILVSFFLLFPKRLNRNHNKTYTHKRGPISIETQLDFSHNSVKYTITTDNSSQVVYVMLSPETELQIYKVAHGQEVICLISPIIVPPSTSQSTINPLIDSTEISTRKDLEILSTPITNKDILEEEGRQFCGSNRVFWWTNRHHNSTTKQNPKDTTTKQTTSTTIQQIIKRHKRQTRYVYLCFWDWSRCYYFIFPGDRTKFRYYKCDTKCSFVDYYKYYGIS